eukprot:gnl/TRDRNA2_/TRDRNA2_136199_c1_seq1.p1 gnl/TRDRNA2_/TRDRNA2_136199_c1~~gnl/TRDRNA2_/TRDRNA2_136199_c1_seq1.p1  ORF type:complete len:259 (+),score=58.59 gnl/TRDRNA2_/TRDRNA2_136199_c1_seq1:40-777(+)
MHQAADRQAAGIERLAERHERISQAVEHLRVEEKSREATVKNTHQKVLQMEDKIKQGIEETQDYVSKERNRHEEHVRRASQALQSEQSKTISELERKLADRLERESVERENNVKQILNEVGKTFDKLPGEDQKVSVKNLGGSITVPMPGPGQPPMIMTGSFMGSPTGSASGMPSQPRYLSPTAMRSPTPSRTAGPQPMMQAPGSFQFAGQPQMAPGQPMPPPGQPMPGPQGSVILAPGAPGMVRR